MMLTDKDLAAIALITAGQACRIQILSLRARLLSIEQYENKTSEMCMEWSHTSVQIDALESELSKLKAAAGE